MIIHYFQLSLTFLHLLRDDDDADDNDNDDGDDVGVGGGGVDDDPHLFRLNAFLHLLQKVCSRQSNH